MRVLTKVMRNDILITLEIRDNKEKSLKKVLDDDG